MKEEGITMRRKRCDGTIVPINNVKGAVYT